MKTLTKIGMAFLAIVLSISFVACSDSDEDDTTEKPTVNYAKLIIGTWTEDGYGDRLVITFNADGTGISKEDDYRDHFSWSITGNQVHFSMEGEEDWTETIETLTDTKLVLVNENEPNDKDRRTTYTRKNSDEDDTPEKPTVNYAKLIIGTWTEDGYENQVALTFKADGTGVSKEDAYKDHFSWSITGNQVHFSMEDEEDWTETIETLTDTKLVLVNENEPNEKDRRTTYTRKNSDEEDDDPVIKTEMLDGIWAVKEKKGIEYYEGRKEEFYETYDVEHPEQGDERIQFSQSTGEEFLYERYKYDYDGWNRRSSETVNFRNNTIYFSFGERKVLKLNADTLILFEAADADHNDTEEVTTTYVRVK